MSTPRKVWIATVRTLAVLLGLAVFVGVIIAIAFMPFWLVNVALGLLILGVIFATAWPQDDDD